MPKYRIVTTAQVERTYDVDAKDEEQGRDRLRIYLKDGELLREGLVEAKPDYTKNVTAEKIKANGVTALSAAKQADGLADARSSAVRKAS